MARLACVSVCTRLECNDIILKYQNYFYFYKIAKLDTYRFLVLTKKIKLNKKKHFYKIQNIILKILDIQNIQVYFITFLTNLRF